MQASGIAPNLVLYSVPRHFEFPHRLDGHIRVDHREPKQHSDSRPLAIAASAHLKRKSFNYNATILE
jgi:hypothetical protein